MTFANIEDFTIVIFTLSNLLKLLIYHIYINFYVKNKKHEYFQELIIFSNVIERIRNIKSGNLII